MNSKTGRARPGNQKRVATVDIGTNSVRLLVADVGEDGDVTVIVRRGDVTRLGEGLEKTGEISAGPRDRTGGVIVNFVEEARKRGASNIVVAGTGALRSAANGPAVAEHFASLTGLAVRILSGEEEARLVFGAAGCRSERGQTTCSVLDIGGGSTEIVHGYRGSVVSWKSVDIGCVRLTERAISHDPPSPDDLLKARKEVETALGPMTLPAEGGHLHCVGGTVTTFASVEKKLSRYEPGKIEGFKMSRETAEEILERLSGMPIGERMTVPGLSPGRADIIIAGGLILCGALNRLGFNEFFVSTRGLRYGLLGLPAA